MASIELTGCQLIAGSISGEGQHTFHALNGSRGQPLPGTFLDATDAEVDRACAAAAACAPLWRQAAPHQRAAFLQRLAEQLAAHAADLLERAEHETAYSPERLQGEFHRMTAQLRFVADFVREGSWVHAIIDPAEPGRQPFPKPDLRRQQVPLGPVAVLGASNFPFAISVVGNDALAAWAAGCPVVVKAHPSHPGTCEMLGQLVQRVIRELELPEGLFALLQGERHAVGARLVAHPHIRAVGFTGSLAGGTALWQIARSRPEPIPFFAELGSLNPVFVLPSGWQAGPEALALGLLRSITLGNGQLCTRPSLVFYVESPEAEIFRTVLAEQGRSFPTAPLLNPGTAAALRAHVARCLEAPQTRVLTTLPEEHASEFGPVVLEIDWSTLSRDPAAWFDECFGPVVTLVRCPDIAALEEATRMIPGGLTTTLHVGSDGAPDRSSWLDRLAQRSGRVVWNGFPTGVEVGHATQHGGPYPASFDGQGTSIGTQSLVRFTRPVCYQDVPDEFLPAALQNANPLGIWRWVNGRWTREPIA